MSLVDQKGSQGNGKGGGGCDRYRSGLHINRQALGGTKN